MKFSASVVVCLATSGTGVLAFTTPLKSTAHGPSTHVSSTATPVEGGSTTTVGVAERSDSTTALFSPIEEQMKVEMPMEVEESSSSAVDRIQPGRYDSMDTSIALPFLRRPSKLDGSHAGDFGFDPLGLTEQFDLYTMQEAELRHARLAMLAVVGWPISELVAPNWMLQGEYGCAPSVLNGFNPLSFLATLAIFAGFGYFEYSTALRNTANTESGKKHLQDMSDVWKYGVAGDYNWDPLNFYCSLGDSAVARKGLRDVEISHGRMAMLGITAFVVWEKLTGHAIVENSMFFHPNLLLPALFGAYVAFNQIYEVTSDDQYLLQVEMTSEGEARLEKFRMQLAGSPEDNEAMRKIVNMVAERTAALAKELGITDKAVELAKEAKKTVDDSGLIDRAAELAEEAKKKTDRAAELAKEAKKKLDETLSEFAQ